MDLDMSYGVSFPDVSDAPVDVSLGAVNPKRKSAPAAVPRARSRLASSREASFRSKQEKIDFYTNNFTIQHKGALHIPQEWYPEGYTIMWIRESIKGYPDAANLARMEGNGWEPVYADEMPQRAFFSPDGQAQDDAQLVRANGMRLMKRLIEIHDAHDKILARDRHRQAQMKHNMRSIDKDLHPFAVHGSLGSNESFFPSDPVANSFAGSFN